MSGDGDGGVDGDGDGGDGGQADLTFFQKTVIRLVSVVVFCFFGGTTDKNSGTIYFEPPGWRRYKRSWMRSDDDNISDDENPYLPAKPATVVPHASVARAGTLPVCRQAVQTLPMEVPAPGKRSDSAPARGTTGTTRSAARLDDGQAVLDDNISATRLLFVCPTTPAHGCAVAATRRTLFLTAQHARRRTRRARKQEASVDWRDEVSAGGRAKRHYNAWRRR